MSKYTGDTFQSDHKRKSSSQYISSTATQYQGNTFREDVELEKRRREEERVARQIAEQRANETITGSDAYKDSASLAEIYRQQKQVESTTPKWYQKVLGPMITNDGGATTYAANNVAKQNYNSAVNEYKKKYNLSDEEYERVYNTYVQDQAQSRAENKNSYSDYVNGDNAEEFKADFEKVKEESRQSGGLNRLTNAGSTEEREAFKAKYNLDEEGLARIRAEQADYEKANKYEQVVNNPDFAKKSAIRDENIDDPLAHFRSGEGISDNRVNQFSAVTMDGTQQFGTGLEFDDTTDTGVNQNWDAINKDEEAVYYYLLNTEGKASAENYLYAIQNRLGARAQQQMTQDIKDMGPVGQTAMFVPAVVANAVGGLYSGIEDGMAWITGNEANPYDKAHQLSNFASAVQQGTGEYLEDNTNFEIRGYNVANELYNAVFSTATSAVGAYTFGKAYNFVMGMSAASQKATEMLQQGYDKDQIIASSVATGIAEAFFEKFSLEVFLGAKGGLDAANLLWNIAKQAGAEASEEYFTELANQISDDLILGNESEAARKITTYIEQGLSKEDAEIKLQKERRGERLHSLVGGALSGGMMGGVASVVNQREYKGAAAERGSVEDGNAVEAAAESAPKISRLGTEYAKMKIGNKVKSAFGGSGELTNAQIGHLSNLIDESIIKSGVDSNFVEANSAEEAKQIYEKKIAEIDSQYKASSDMVEQDYQDGKISLDAAMDLNERNENDVEKMKQQLKQGLDKTVEAFESGKAKGFKAMQKAYVSEMEKSGNVDRSEGNVGSLSDQRLAELRVPDIETDVGEQAKGFSSQNIVKVENGNITVDIEGNESTVDIGSIKDSTAKVLWAKAAKMPTAAAAQAFIENYSGGSIDSYHNAFKSVYDLAVAGYSEEQTREAASFKWTYLGDNLATKIYNAGLVNAISGASKGFTNMLTRDLKQIVGSQKAKVVKSEIEIVKYVAQKYNIDVVLVDRLDVDGSLKNGQYNRDTGKIILALEGSDEGALLTRTLGHEMYHYLAHNNENGASELEKFVKEYFTKTKSAEWLDKFIEDTYSEYAEDKRMEEFVADQMFDVFSNEKAVYEFAATNKNAFKKLYNHLKKLISDIKTFINDLANKKDDKGNYLYEDMRAFLDNGNEGLQALEKISDMFLAALNDTTGEKLADIPGVNVQMEFSRARDKEFYNKANEYNDEQLRKEGRVQYVDPLLLNKAAGARARIAIEMEKRKEALALPEDIEGKTNIGNSSYGITEENTTMCPRSLALTEFANAVSEILGRPMTVKEQLILADEASAHYRNNECIYCYVAMDRKAKEEFVGTYLKERNKVIKEVKAGADREEVYQKWLAGEYGGIKRSDKASAALRKRFNMWMNVLDSGKQFIEAKDLASHEAQDRAMTSSDKNIAMQAKDCMKYAQSASYAKKILDYRAYNGHILRWNDKKIKELNNNFGLRMYSFSDYSPAYILENMQMITDASVKGLKMLAYTKEADFVNIFADSGININVSTFGVWDEASGTVIEDQMYGVEWEKAKQLRSEHKNVGIVFVATNDNLVDWALEQDWIDVIIPFHQVKTGDIVAEHFGFHNFTNETEDKKKMGWNRDKHKKSIYPPDHKNDKETYLRLCEENYLSPRFERWKGHPNYMRLVNETRLSSDDTPVVQPIFDLNAALDSLKEMERVGGYVEHVGVRLEETHRLAEKVAKEILKQTTEVESDYTDYSTARGQQYAPTFFSQMGKVVDGLNQKKFGTQDLVKMLTGRGVKAEEIKWSGIEEWLQDKGKSVTKEELQEFIAGSMLQIEQADSSKGDIDVIGIDKINDEEYVYYRPDEPYDKYSIYLTDNGKWYDSESGREYDSIEDFKNEINRQASESGNGKWSNYKADGGSHYREIIFKMPGSDYTNRAMDVHWGQHGVLAHARIQDMPDSTGANMLFIEEIQSDWHNEGQKKGYRDNSFKITDPQLVEDYIQKLKASFKEDGYSVSYAGAYDYIMGQDNGFYMSNGTSGTVWARPLIDKIFNESEIAEIKNIRESFKQYNKVPDVPFKNGKYVDFVLKNLLREAAENGYDKLAWTPSEMQSERWSDDYAEGYRIEYDQDIPKFLNKFGKKFGAKVGVSYINAPDAETVQIKKNTIQMSEELLEVTKEMYGEDSREYKSELAGIEQLRKEMQGTPVWSIDITPEMKQSVLYEGQPMYSNQRDKALDTKYFDAIEKYGKDSPEVQAIVDEKANEYLNSMLLPDDSDEQGFKYHRGPAPTKTFKRYAVFNVSEDGFRAAYAGNKNATPVGVWIDAQNLQSYLSDVTQFADGSFASYIKGDTGVSAGQKFSEDLLKEYGLSKSSRMLLERGGKHSSDVPNFSQMNTGSDENGNSVTNKSKDGALPHNKLIFEIEYGITDGGDLTEYVKENGRFDKAGKNQGLAKIGPNQYYDFKTNPNAVGNWGIGGTFRITRLVEHDEIVSETKAFKEREIAKAEAEYKSGNISKSDRDKRIKNASAIGVQKWVGGYHPEDFNLSVESVNDMVKAGSKMKLTDPVTYDDNGNIIPLSQRFNPDSDDLRYSSQRDKEIDDNYFAAIEKYGEDSGEVENIVYNHFAKLFGADNIVEGWHGTMNYGFNKFEKLKAHTGGNSGAGFYMTTNIDDAEQNYADVEGADNYFKWSKVADQIMDAGEWDGEEVTEKKRAIEIAKSLMSNGGTYHLYGITKNPYIRDFRHSTNIYNKIMEGFDESIFDEDDYDSEEDYEDAIFEARGEHLYTAINEKVREALNQIYDVYEDVMFHHLDDLINNIWMAAYDYEKLTWSDIFKEVNKYEVEAFVDWSYEGSLSLETEFTRAIVEAFGYDAVLDKEVSQKFNQLKSMYGGTEHLIVFNPSQLKRADGVVRDDEGNIIPLSKRGNLYNDDMRYMSPRSKLTSNSQKVYNNKAEQMYDWLTSDRATTYNDSINKWVFDNEIFSRSEISSFEEQVSDIVRNRSAHEKEKLNNGEYAIIVENKIVFTDVDDNNPYISEILEVLSEYGRSVETIREMIYANERRIRSNSGIQNAPYRSILPKGYILRYRADDKSGVDFVSGKGKGKNRKAALRNCLRQRFGKTDAGEDPSGTFIRFFEDYSTPRQPAYVPEDQDYWNNWINENEKERLFSILDEALNERRGDYTGEGTVNVKRKLNENQIKNIAKSLREEYKSNVNPTEFSNAIEKIYTDILNSNEVMWDSVLLRASVVAKDMLAGTNADEEWTPTEVALKIAENYFRTDEVMTDDLRRYLKKEKSKALKKAQRQKAQDKLDNVRSEYREKIKTERAASKEKLSEMRSEYRGIIKDLKEKHDTEIKERDAEIRYLTRQSERLGKEIDKRKLAEKVRNERRRERASARELRDKIKSRYFKLVKAMEKPTEKQHIPEGLLGMVGEVLGTIDLTENDVRKNGTVIKSRRERNARLADLLVTYNSYAEDPKYNMYYDEGISAMINSIAKDTNGKSVAEMNSSELEDVYNLVKALDHTVRTALKTEIAGKEYQAMWLADEMVEETLSVNGKKDNAINKYWNSQLRADTMFNRLAGYKPNSAWSIAGQLLNDGQLEKTRIMIEGTRAFNDLVSASKDLERLSDINDLVDVGLVNENDEKIMITRGMMLSLYMHLLNEQNARHFERGGVAIPDIKAYYKGNNEKAWGTGKVYTKAYVKTLNDISHKIDLAEYNGDLSEADRLRDQYEDFEREMAERVEGIRVKIENLLGPENSYERQWIRKAQWFFDTFSKDLSNNATKKMYGFEKAKVVNYFPIHTDKDSRAAQFDSIKRDFALENSGFMKDRIKGASNTILLEDITDVIADHLKKTADYAGLAPAIKDFNKIYGRAMQTGETSVQRAVNSKFGLAGKRYIEKLLGDLQGANKSENTEIFGINIDRARGHLAQAVLSLNFRVTLAQAASFPTAAAEIGWKPLRKALISIEKDDGTKHYGLSKAEKELIEKYTPLLAWRLQGNSNTELGNIRETRKGSEGWMLQKTSKIMDWISQMDGATVGRLWYASKYYVDDNFSDLKKGSDEYYQKVAEVFNRVVEKTQPNYSVMQRPEILRSTNNIVKAMTMFMTQRLQNFNIIYDSVSKLDKYNKDIKAGKNGITQEDIDRAKTDVVRAVTSQVAASATIVAIKAIVDALMHNFKPYKKKDEDELVWSTVVSKLGNMLIETEVSSMLWGSELYDFLSKMITGETYYGVSVSGVDTINDILNDFTSLRQKPTPAKCFSLAVNVCQFFGIPASNAKKIADMIYDWIADTVDGEVNLNRKGIIDLLNK